MTDTPIGASALGLDATPPDTVTLLDGSTVPLPASTPEQPAIGVLRQQAMGRIAELKGNEEFRKLLLSGNAEALAEVARLDRIIKTPTGTFVGGQQTPAQVEQHQTAWRDNADVGAIYGAAVEQQFRDGQPISEQEHRAAQARLAERKSDREFVKRYFDGGVKERAEMQLLHRMLQLPVLPK
jgi:hypothetical protein